MKGWKVRRTSGGSGTLSHSYFAIAPACPDGRHPTRDCQCKVFRTQAEAEAYIAEQETAA